MGKIGKETSTGQVISLGAYMGKASAGIHYHFGETPVSEHDQLTGIYNRHGFNRAFERELNTANTGGGVLMLIDIDRLKDVNTVYGRPVGDAVLKLVADVIGVQTGENDIVARLHKDKFAVAFTDVENETGEYKATRLTKMLNGLYLKIHGMTVPIRVTTISAPYSKNSEMGAMLSSVVVIMNQKKQSRIIPSFLG